VAYDQPRGRYDLYRVRLSGGGEIATGKLLRPRQGDGPFPAVLLNDGRELNSAALDYLPPEFGDVLVLSLDYPDGVPYEFDPFTVLLQNDCIRSELRRIPRLFSLGGAYLTQRADVDSSRVAMVVTSFAVPFGVRAAAEDRTRNTCFRISRGIMRSDAIPRSTGSRLSMAEFSCSAPITTRSPSCITPSTLPTSRASVSRDSRCR